MKMDDNSSLHSTSSPDVEASILHFVFWPPKQIPLHALWHWINSSLFCASTCQNKRGMMLLVLWGETEERSQLFIVLFQALFYKLKTACVLHTVSDKVACLQEVIPLRLLWHDDMTQAVKDGKPQFYWVPACSVSYLLGQVTTRINYKFI